jgi:hypothetical protein
VPGDGEEPPAVKLVGRKLVGRVGREQLRGRDDEGRLRRLGILLARAGREREGAEDEAGGQKAGRRAAKILHF